MNTNHRVARLVYNNPDYFVYKASGRYLRSYQRDVLNAIIQSIREKAGRSFVIIFSRQSGKNELQAQMFVYLLAALSNYALNIVSVSPTFKPQTLNAMNRLDTVLSRNIFTRLSWKRTEGFKYRVGKCRVIFLSGDPSANVVGETAHILLSIDEAQDISINRFDKSFAPMTAAHNATRVFWGTSWISDTLLSRERRAAEAAQKADGIRRVWIVPGPEIAKEVPSYADFLASEIKHLGRNHPIIRTQYFCEEIDAQAGMFNPTRRALMTGDQPAHDHPLPGVPCAFLLDVAGQDEARMSLDDDAPLQNQGRDSVSLTIVDLDLSTLATLQAPTYRVAHRLQWLGLNHLVVFGQIKALAEAWNPLHIVIDATGVGEGMWALLDKSFPSRVIPVKFSRQEKSEIGYRFLAVIETGRFRDLCLTDDVRMQYDKCVLEILPGPAKSLRWGVPEGARGPTGELIHDDYVLADALVAVLDRMEWCAQTAVEANEGFDPLVGTGYIPPEVEF